MLRNSLRSVRAVGSRPIASAVARQWQPVAITSPAARRFFADEHKKPSIDDSKPVKLPVSETNTAASSEIKVPLIDPQGATPIIDAKNVPLTPPEPPAAVPPPPAPEASLPPPPPPPPPPVKKRGFFSRLRRYVLTLILLGAISFGGGVWYSRINDNFHDFFTEYIPFGEQAVLYLEELEFRKRYPRSLDGSARSADTGPKVKIAPQSGASWRVADSGEPAGRQSSAMSSASSSAKSEKKTEEKPAPAPKAEEPKTAAAAAAAVSAASTAASTEAPKAEAAAPAAEPAPKRKSSRSRRKRTEFKEPEVDEPSRFPPPGPIDPFKINGAADPVVQDLVKMLNDIIAVVNADPSADRFSSTIWKAKQELGSVGSKIQHIKTKIENDAAAHVEAKVKEFDRAANELVERVEGVMAAQETQWRKEWEEEVKRIQSTYESRMKTEIEREKQINDGKLKNQLLEQAVELKRQFVQEVKGQVEVERKGRLGKLEQLSSAVKELENLTTGWNDVVDTNLRTQQLHVAVEAVRASLDDDEHPRPFVRELVALKEIASDDAVVNAAIGSINPSAYQRGIATPSQLIDRFRRVASEVRKASLLPEDAGVASHASSFILSKVMFKKQGLAAGDDVESILTRTQTYLEEGNLDAAAREMNGLEGWAKTLSRDWLGEVRKVLEVQQALDVIATQARLQSLQVE
ncbi:mitochondrial inner membrane protein Mitofilin [Xylariaceae sp. FL0255]|nr:mitochondrial inner membrane protein Mitofilin [Xylariaceae sp. FL0255]